MFPIEITVDIQSADGNTPEALMIGVVQLPCVPTNGMRLISPDDYEGELELMDVAYCLRRQMFMGMLTDIASGDDIESTIKSWEGIGLYCDWRNGEGK